jgi:RIO-like serine/threonine protein kinase
MATRNKYMQAGACDGSRSCVGLFRALLLKELNKNKIIILRRASGTYKSSVTSALRELSNTYGIPLSTLKQSACSLKNLGLIEYGTAEEPKELTITKTGINALKLMATELDETDS